MPSRQNQDSKMDALQLSQGEDTILSGWNKNTQGISYQRLFSLFFGGIALLTFRLLWRIS